MGKKQASEIQDSGAVDDITKNGYAALISMVVLYVLFQNEILYTEFKRGILNKNRYIPSDTTIKFFDKVKENLKISTSYLRKGRTLYRARITDGKFDANFLKSIFEKITDQQADEFDFEALGDVDFSFVQSLFAVLDEEKYTANIQEFITNFNNKQFQGFDAENSIEPPASMARDGRLNPSKISYLYTAEDIKTAIYEVKPIIGQTVSVAKLKTLKTLKVLDLTKHFQEDIHRGNDGFELHYKNIMAVISDAFKIPNYNEPLEYVPTQYFAEYIKEIHSYDAIKYWSSLKKGGKNIVIFNSELCEVLSSKLVGVMDIKLNMQELSSILCNDNK